MLELLLSTKSWVELKVTVSVLGGPVWRVPALQQQACPALRAFGGGWGHILCGGNRFCPHRGKTKPVLLEEPQCPCVSQVDVWPGRRPWRWCYVTLGLRSGFGLYDWQN